jgi:hypothetical protein
MNERWKDLIKQAIQEIGPEDNPSKEETLKRYAELIVRECADIANTAEPYKSADLILKRFGVPDDQV